MIRVRKFNKRYRAFSISIESLDVLRVLVLKGSNGSGKSTLLKAIKGLIRYKGRITGECFLLGKLDFPNRLTGKDVSFIYGTIPFRKRLRHLSKGQMQKLKIDSAFTFDNILLDEPLDGLDQVNRKYLIDLVKKSHASILIATHSNMFDEYEIYRI